MLLGTHIDMNSTDTNAIDDTLSRFGVIPVVTISDPAHALPLADALIDGGLPIVEIAFRTPAAASVVRTLTLHRGGLIVGAGTILTPIDAQVARESGAAFGVAPGLNPRVIEQARHIGLPFIPGVCTPTETERALEIGCKLLKFFPAEAIGGARTLEALAGPYRHTGVRFVPTGGVNPENLERYSTCDSVAAVGGTWIATPEDIASGRWQQIADKCRAATATIRRIRAK